MGEPDTHEVNHNGMFTVNDEEWTEQDEDEEDNKPPIFATEFEDKVRT